MKIVVDVSDFLPEQQAGAEHMVAEIMDHLRSDFDFAIVKQKGGTKPFQGWPVYKRGDDTPYKGADGVISHLQGAGNAFNKARKYGLPIVHIVHNYNRAPAWRTNKVPTALVFNTEHLMKVHSTFIPPSNPMTVFRTIIDPSKYATETSREFYTLINGSPLKGGPEFIEIARRLPDKKFLIVRGAYGDQPREQDIPANVTMIDTTSNIVADVYARTRVLFYCSIYETWGRCFSEAAASGIPAIITTTPGLLEQAPDDWPYRVDVLRRSNIDLWIEQVIAIEDKYQSASQAARLHALKLWSENDVDRLRSFFLRFITNKNK